MRYSYRNVFSLFISLQFFDKHWWKNRFMKKGSQQRERNLNLLNIFLHDIVLFGMSLEWIRRQWFGWLYVELWICLKEFLFLYEYNVNDFLVNWAIAYKRSFFWLCSGIFLDRRYLEIRLGGKYDILLDTNWMFSEFLLAFFFLPLNAVFLDVR